MKLTLKEPIKVGEKGEPITELNFRERIVSGDLRGIKLSSLADPTTDEVLKIAGRLTGKNDLEMAQLGLADLDEVIDAVRSFIKAGQTTGTTASP